MKIKKGLILSEGLLSDSILHKIKSELSLEWTYHSNRIVGHTFNLNETRVVLEHGMTIKGKSLREHFEIVNYHEAIDFITSLVDSNYVLSEKDILEVHGIIMTRIEKNSRCVTVTGACT